MFRFLPLALFLAGVPLLAAEDVPLTNPSFDEGLTDQGVPVGWARYGGGQEGQKANGYQGSLRSTRAARQNVHQGPG